MLRGFSRRVGDVHQPAVRLAPGTWMTHFHFPYAFEDRPPEFSEDSKGFSGHHGFVQHLPNDGQLDQRSRTALAGHESVGYADQLKQSLFPGFLVNFDVNPSVELRGLEECCRHAVSFSTGFSGTAGDGL